MSPSTPTLVSSTATRFRLLSAQGPEHGCCGVDQLCRHERLTSLCYSLPGCHRCGLQIFVLGRRHRAHAVLRAEWEDREAFTKHIKSDYVKKFAEYITEVLF